MRICVAGLGGAGSTIVREITEELGSAIEEIHLIDMDRVEVANLANQAYDEEDAGEYKTHATRRRIEKRLAEPKTRIYTYNVDVKRVQECEGAYLLRKCDVFISAMDSYESRVNFYYSVVREVENARLYIDCGVERYQAHCFYTEDRKPCIYCIRWMYPREKEIRPLCSQRNTPEEVSEETKGSAIAGMLRQSGGNRDISGDKKRQQGVADRFNKRYRDTLKREIEIEEVEEVERLGILPNISTTNVILASVVVLVVKQRRRCENTTDKKGNFILYSGNSKPVFYQHLLLHDDNCFLCR